MKLYFLSINTMCKISKSQATPSVRKVCGTEKFGVLAPQSVQACPSTQWEGKSNKKNQPQIPCKISEPLETLSRGKLIANIRKKNWS